MQGRRVRHQPDSTAGIENDNSTESDIAVSTNRCMKRCSDSQLLNSKSQRRLRSSNNALVSSPEYGSRTRIDTELCNQSVACKSKDPSSSSYVTFPDQQQLSDDTLSASASRLLSTFFDQPCVQLARNLLGKYLVRISEEDGKRLSGRIVETEAYVGTEDCASHSYGGRRTARNEAMYMPPGTSYVYNIYGIYTCINISSRGMLYY